MGRVFVPNRRGQRLSTARILGTTPTPASQAPCAFALYGFGTGRTGSREGGHRGAMVCRCLGEYSTEAP